MDFPPDSGCRFGRRFGTSVMRIPEVSSSLPVPVMPSVALQSRIQAFEALSAPSSSSSLIPVHQTPSSTTPPKSNDSTTSTNFLDTPISPTASILHPISPFTPSTASSRSPSPSPPNLGRKTSLIDLKDWIIEDGLVDGPSTFRHTLSGGTSTSKLNGIRELSKTPPPRKPIPTYRASNVSVTPLINLESPPKPRPALPPRKPSYNDRDREPAPAQRSVSGSSETGATLRPPARSDSLTIDHTYPPGVHRFGAGRIGHAPASSISSFHSVSLSSDGSNIESIENTTKPPSFTFDADTSSITDIDTASIAESFENVSVPSAVSPSMAIPFDWEKAMGKSKSSPKLEPPRLPQRPGTKAPPPLPPKPLSRSVSASSSSTTISTNARRPPPPPPPYLPFSRSRPPSSRASLASTSASASASDRSSILSNATTTSRTSTSTRSSAQVGSSAKPSALLRETPVPPAARARYESLFCRAVQGRRKAERKRQKSKVLAPTPLSVKKGRQAAGWRGLSVDLITNHEDHPYLSADKEKADEINHEDEEDSVIVGPEERLNGRIVKHIWNASRLDRKKLRDIWNDCDPQAIGSLDRDAFVKGMWRIDEELRRAQLARRTSALSAASSQRIPHRPLPPPRMSNTSQLLI
ncbi:hypothetical protein BU15DRAFT_58464 [Melanogaster broomeanus]|nr:hypothetical protein BU15DRAFT_58464 [Melanogaster broomeanus]